MILLDGLQDILRVIFPFSNKKELRDMLQVVMRKRRVQAITNIEEQIKELREIFKTFDDDHTGELDHEEFVDALCAAGIGISPACWIRGYITNIEAVVRHGRDETRVVLIYPGPGTQAILWMKPTQCLWLWIAIMEVPSAWRSSLTGISPSVDHCPASYINVQVTGPHTSYAVHALHFGCVIETPCSVVGTTVASQVLTEKPCCRYLHNDPGASPQRQLSIETPY
jgi:hypothetical protein